jgi:hypothetical protein
LIKPCLQAAKVIAFCLKIKVKAKQKMIKPSKDVFVSKRKQRFVKALYLWETFNVQMLNFAKLIPLFTG